MTFLLGEIPAGFEGDGFEINKSWGLNTVYLIPRMITNFMTNNNCSKPLKLLIVAILRDNYFTSQNFATSFTMIFV